MKVQDEYTYREFADLLYAAEINAQSKWDVAFVDALTEKFEDWSIEMFLSDNQHEQLKRIARVG